MTTIFRIIIALSFFSSISAFALPQYTLLTGNRCINCHVNVQGGGLRNELGWYSSKDESLIPPKSIGLVFLRTARTSNTILDSTFIIGVDSRFQIAKSPKDETAARRFFPMQLSIYADWLAAKWLQIDGTYNAGPIKYDGQKSGELSAIIEPSQDLPQLRLGFFEPSIGVRYDDHTMLIRNIAGTYGQTLIAPYYAELGGELNYYSIPWLQLTAGAFMPNSLAENKVTYFSTTSSVSTISLVGDEKQPALLFRAMLSDRFFEDQLNVYAGASYLQTGNLANSDFMMTNIFLGAGLTDKVILMGEYAMSDKKNVRQTKNWMINATYQFMTSVYVNARWERGITSVTNSKSYQTDQGIIGLQMLVLPFFEIRPEYRYVWFVDNNESHVSTRYAMQFHIFY